MEKVFDYAGNEIKPHDEVAIIRVIDRQFFRAGIPAAISESGKDEEIMERKLPDAPCWEIIEYIKLDFNMGWWVQGKNSECGSYEVYNTIYIYKHVFMHQTQILAIKGISDTKEYYDIWKSLLVI